MRDYDFTCDDCSEEFTICATGTDKPTVCPFCGADLENTRDNEHDDED
jgi:predicted nucleic acid-binding Zn ribbon protein